MTKQIRDLSVEYVSVDRLTPYGNNARRHSKRHIGQIARSIEIFGWTNPILTDASYHIIAGHVRQQAAILLGLKTVPTIRLDCMTEEQVRAYIVADNRLAELADWDEELLAMELQGLLEMDLDFDIEVIGFETAEIDLILQAGQDTDPGDLADVVPVREGRAAPVSAPGDLWCLGRHRLLCADARDQASYRTLLGDRKARMAFTDPPYNVPIDGHVCGLGATKHAEFAMATGELSSRQFTAFLRDALGSMAHHSVNGALHFICMDWRHLWELQSAGREVYDKQVNLCVWNKTNGGMGSLYRSKHELVAVFKVGTAPHVNNVGLGRFGRNRTNVWDYRGTNSFGPEREEAQSLHPTVKPVALVADAILDCSRRGDVVLDPFCGSGSTILAAERTGRVAHAIELDPHYVDIAIERYERVTGATAYREEDGADYRSLRDDQDRAGAEGSEDE